MISVPESNDQPVVLDQVKLTRRMIYFKSLVDDNWVHWTKEYLTQLCEYQNIGKNTRFISEGDIVVKFSHEMKRNSWKIGKVVELLCGPDNIPRAALLRVGDVKKAKFIRRPIRKLYPLEINANFPITNHEKMTIPENINNDDEFDGDENNERPKRIAAENGEMIQRITGQV